MIDVAGKLQRLVDQFRHMPPFVGHVWYVDGTNGNDGMSGETGHAAFATIGAAITACAAGDAIKVKAATYTETGLDLDEASVELWLEAGTILDPASGTVLTVSGDHCVVKGDVDVPAAQIGVLVSGDYCTVSDGTILYGATGVHVTGAGGTLTDMAIGFQTTVSYDVDGAQTRLFWCHTVGNAATVGFNIGGGADTGVLKGCTSSGHQTAGFNIETGCQDWTLLDCSSGAGDGRWADADNANVWSGFTFDDQVYHTTTFNASGPSDNLFRVYGSVLITGFRGDVSTVLAGDIGNGYIELYDGTNTVDVTDSPGPSFNSLPVESLLHKIDDATVQIAIEDSSQVRLYEDATKFGEDPHFQITAKAATATYIRLVYSDTATSGAIHWHCIWEPLTDDGFVAAA